SFEFISRSRKLVWFCVVLSRTCALASLTFASLKSRADCDSKGLNLAVVAASIQSPGARLGADGDRAIAAGHGQAWRHHRAADSLQRIERGTRRSAALIRWLTLLATPAAAAVLI